MNSTLKLKNAEVLYIPSYVQQNNYSVNELDSLPQKLSLFKVSTKSNDEMLGFFGELCPFSNFYPAEFTHNGINYHSSEQLIQHQKALYCNLDVAERILSTKTAIACKQLSYTTKKKKSARAGWMWRMNAVGKA